MPEQNDFVREAILRIGVDPDDLGFVGLEVVLPSEYRATLHPSWLYHSPTVEFAQGAEGTPHITLIYGLLFSADLNLSLVGRALEGWHKPNLVVMPEVKAFHANDGNADYAAIVLALGDNEYDLSKLKEANDRLRKLPHVNGFPVYDPHVTVGYVHKEFADLAVARLKEIEVRPLHTRELEYS